VKTKSLQILIFFYLFYFILYPSFLYSIVGNENLARPEVQKTIELFLTVERAFIQRGLNNAPAYLPLVKKIVSSENLPVDLIYLPIIESSFSVRAYSSAGASGLWQFMPVTATDYGLRVDFWVDERRDPEKSTRKAIKHLKNLYRYYNNWDLVLAAYNAGMGAVNQAIRTGGTKDYWKLCSMGLLRKETREYVPRFCAATHIARNAKQYGFEIEPVVFIPEHEILKVTKPVDLTVLGEKTGIRVSTFQLLNPELRRLVTPFGREYNLRVPKDRFAKVLAAYLKLPEDELAGVTGYVVRTGQTLSEIALRFDISVKLLKSINGILNERRLYVGQKLILPVKSKAKDYNEAVFVPKRGFNTQEIQYFVKKGDTLWGIADKYNTDVETLLAVNGLSFDSTLIPGDRITLWVDLPFQR